MTQPDAKPGVPQVAPCSRSLCEGVTPGGCWDPERLGHLGSILGRKWTLTILATLQDGPVRHGHLCRRLKPIARKVLHDSLDGLVADGLVEKIIGMDDCGNAAVSYGLTPLGASLHTVIDAMQAWSDQHSPAMGTRPPQTVAS